MMAHLLVPLDGCPLAECVLPHVVAIGRALDARVTLLRAVRSSSAEMESRTPDPLMWHMRKTEAAAYLNGVARRLQGVGLAAEPVVVEGRPARQILDFARAEDVGLIVLSSHGRSGLSGWNINSVAAKVALRTYTDLMIVRAYGSNAADVENLRYRRLLVPLDGSARAEGILPLATKLAQSHSSRLLAAHVVRQPEMPHRFPLTEEESALGERMLEAKRQRGTEYLRLVTSTLSMPVTTRLLLSRQPAEALHELVNAEEVDLVLMMAHGYSGNARRPYGSTALNFIAHGTAPLLIVQDLPWERAQTTAAERAAQQAPAVRLPRMAAGTAVY